MISYTKQRAAMSRIQEQIKKRQLPESPAIHDVLEAIDQAERIEQLFKAIYATAAGAREECKHCASVANVIEDSGIAGP